MLILNKDNFEFIFFSGSEKVVLEVTLVRVGQLVMLKQKNFYQVLRYIWSYWLSPFSLPEP